MVFPFNVYAVACRSTPTLITPWNTYEAPRSRPAHDRSDDGSTYGMSSTKTSEFGLYPRIRGRVYLRSVTYQVGTYIQIDWGCIISRHAILAGCIVLRGPGLCPSCENTSGKYCGEKR